MRKNRFHLSCSLVCCGFGWTCRRAPRSLVRQSAEARRYRMAIQNREITQGHCYHLLTRISRSAREHRDMPRRQKNKNRVGTATRSPPAAASVEKSSRKHSPAGLKATARISFAGTGRPSGWPRGYVSQEKMSQHGDQQLANSFLCRGVL